MKLSRRELLNRERETAARMDREEERCIKCNRLFFPEVRGEVLCCICQYRAKASTKGEVK